ncbi:MAG TPA: LytTR family DNA-binding domain-containing protein [Kofleriaceae bacterium]|nr:LytTR family DNA-binding domain-containing protein [Kofleriaceae bacterium]
MKRRVYLVDDEPLALVRLARLLDATGRVEIVGQATDPERALVEIAARAPIELAFLDISMPGRDGFAVARALPAEVMVVFTTAHDQHALRAFEVNAIDYLCKPVRDDELARALDKLDRLRAVPELPERIPSRLGDRVQLVELDHISHFYAEDKLTYAVAGERSYVIDPTIAELEARYAAAGFFRIHRATLVRLAAIAELRAGTDGTRVRLADGRTELAVARDRVRDLKDKLGLC